MVEINGVTIDFDLTDADNWTKINKAVEKMEEFDKSDQYDESDIAACITHGCQGYELFFDEVFGEGTSDKIFHGKKSLKAHKDAFISITDMAREQMTEAVDFSEVRKRYSADRTQRNDFAKKNSRHHNRNHK